MAEFDEIPAAATGADEDAGLDATAGLAARDRKVRAQVLAELENVVPGRHRARWRRIHELKAELDALWQAHPPKRRGGLGNPVSDSPERQVLVVEYAWLKSVEREFAIVMDWPVWQEGQHFRFFWPPDGRVWWGSVVSIDIEDDTLLAMAWNEDDGQFSWDTGSHRQWTVTRLQVIEGEHLCQIRENVRSVQEELAPPPPPKVKKKRVKKAPKAETLLDLLEDAHEAKPIS